MDERRVEPNANFDQFRALMGKVAAEIVGIGYDRMPLAAE
jgi:hypothetical protein